jgi:hypothetical protein
MKKAFTLLVVLFLLAGCSTSSQNQGQPSPAQTSPTPAVTGTVDNNQQDDATTEDNDTDTEDTDTEASTDASVEVLTRLGDDFMKAAFKGSIDEMAEFCQGDLCDDMSKNSKKYIGTKTSYEVNNIDVFIKKLEPGKYQLKYEVEATKKGTKVKSVFKYLATVLKVKGDYYITTFERD